MNRPRIMTSSVRLYVQDRGFFHIKETADDQYDACIYNVK